MHWASPGAWLLVLVLVPVLCSRLRLGLSGDGVSALLDPPEITSTPPSAPVVRPA